MALAKTSHSPLADTMNRLTHELEDAKITAAQLREAFHPSDTGTYDSAMFQKEAGSLLTELTAMGRMMTDLASYRQTNQFLVTWMIVMLVTFAETYIQDALLILISRGFEGSLLPSAVRADITNEWIRNAIRRGSPHSLITQVSKFGVIGYSQELINNLTRIWARRNQIVHSAEPEINQTAPQEFIDAAQFVNAFVEITDRGVVGQPSLLNS
jgi:hypothetical protein